MVVFGEWVSSIERTIDYNMKDIFGILIPQALWAFLAINAC